VRIGVSAGCGPAGCAADCATLGGTFRAGTDSITVKINTPASRSALAVQRGLGRMVAPRHRAPTLYQIR
jgi:hypothetical protein